jgi:gliding motility-associated-like protein
MKALKFLFFLTLNIKIIYSQTHFTVQQTEGCNTLQVITQNNHPSNGYTPVPFQTTGFTYSWNFGNGQTSTLENPVINYTQPGTYTINYSCTIDTVGFYLTGIYVTQVNCTDPFNGKPDPYIIIKDVNGTTVFTTEGNHINNQNPPYSWGFNIRLNNPPYFLWVWDYDSMDADDNCVDDSENQPGVATVITLPANNSSTFGNTNITFTNGGLIFTAYFHKPTLTFHDSVIITIHQSPNSPVISPNNLTFCLGEQPQTYTALGNTNSTFTWYSDSTLTNIYHTGQYFNTNTSQEGIFNYYVVQTDNITGCTSQPSIATYIVNRIPQPIISQNSITICTGQILQPIVAQGSYPKYWYSDSTLTNLITTGDTLHLIQQQPGTYTYYVIQKDESKNCTSIPTILTVTYIQGIEIQSSVQHVTCYGQSNGSIDVQITAGTPPFTFFWLHGDNSLNLQNLQANEYVLTVLDNNQCIRIFSIFVNQPSPIVVNEQINNPKCYNEPTGSIHIQVNGGTSPYQILWSTGSTQNTINNLLANNYSVTITDNNQCTSIEEYTLIQPEPITIEHEISKENCNGSNDGKIKVKINGGTLPYTVLWSNNQIDTIIQNLHQGTYTVTVTDINFCTETKTIQLTSEYDFCLDIPNVFTPNGDGVNDTWNIKFIDMYSNPTVIVFDNTGKKLYESSGHYTPWDGKINGKPLPLGSYFYTIKLNSNNEKNIFTGTLDIIY